MDDALQRETEKLTRSWMQYDASMLRDYLVQGVEDPRINIQSILTRHFLIVALFGARFQSLLEEELRFATVMNWLSPLLERVAGPEDLLAIRHALETGADDAEGLVVPKFVSNAYAAHRRRSQPGAPPPAITDYIRPFLAPVGGEASDRTLSAFEHIWNKILRPENLPPVSVLEVACGSANDYRFLEAYGLARFLEYTGVDLCEKNIANSQAMFPRARFKVGNALAIEAEDGAFDYCLVQDLFEHLSLEAMERALSEVCRVSRVGVCLGFFNLHEADEHVVRPVDDYHWNQLSAPRLRETLEAKGFDVQIIHIDTFLKWRFACAETHNRNAYTIFAARRASLDFQGRS